MAWKRVAAVGLTLALGGATAAVDPWCDGATGSCEADGSGLSLVQVRPGQKHEAKVRSHQPDQCPESGVGCSGNQCCPGTKESGDRTVPCPTADEDFNGCQVKMTPPKHSTRSGTPHHEETCPGSGNHCTPNQCCPGFEGSDGKTFPCPTSDAGFSGCQVTAEKAFPRQENMGSSESFSPEGPLTAVNGESSKLVITEDGVKNTYYLPGATVIDDGMNVSYTPPYRFYLMNTMTTDYSDQALFYRPPLVGKTFSVDMYYGPNGPGCGCNLNFYLVDMPSVKGTGDYYCDAQCFPDHGCCVEFDMYEGNAEVSQITNHACNAPYSQDPSWKCNKWGDPEFKTTPAQFGPGPQHTVINTNDWYTYSQKFEDIDGYLMVTTTLSQAGRSWSTLMDGRANPEVQAMKSFLEAGLVLVTGYWTAPDMNWLDGDSCGSGPETCNNNPAQIANWRIETNGPSPPGPSPGPTPGPSPGPTPSGDFKCCWGSTCGTCTGESDFCDTNEASCNQCSGLWCPK